MPRWGRGGEGVKKKVDISKMTDEEFEEYVARLNRQTMVINRVTLVVLALTTLIQLLMIVRAVWF